MRAIRYRRSFAVLCLVCCLLVGTRASAADRATGDVSAHAGLADLERDWNCRIGLSACDLESGKTVGHRSGERFSFCSTFKAVLVGAVLRKSMDEPDLLDKPVRIPKESILSWAPVTSPKAGGTLSVKALCEATLVRSDNTAANLLLAMVGGPKGLTAYARGLGDNVFRLDRWEPDLNQSLPGDERDTTSPGAMQATLTSLLLGDALGKAERELLQGWMIDCATGAAAVRAAVPEGWTVADKTGSGAYGTTNDIAVIWPETGKPVVIAVYVTGTDEQAENHQEIIAKAAAIALRELGCL